MLAAARHGLEEASWDLAVFLAEQGLQLYLKSLLLGMSGEIPRTHSPRQLLQALRIFLPEKASQIDDLRRSRSLLIRLEEAYLRSRYLARPYTQEEAQELVSFAEEATRFVQALTGQSRNS